MDDMKCYPSPESILKCKSFQWESCTLSIEAVIEVNEVALKSALPAA